jgi:hypothetical protein
MAEEKNEESGIVLGPNYPGSDPVEKAKYEVDLNFPEEITDEVLNEEETTEEVTEETVAEDNQDENETDGDITAEETTEDAEEPAESEETTEEAEPELEEVAELEEEAEPEPKKPMVPKSRLDEVLAKQRKLQEQLDALTAQKEVSSEEPAPEPYDFDSKELEYQEHVLNGETDKAVALRKEIREAEKNQLEFEIGQKFSQHTEESKEIDALQVAAKNMETKYPMFDQYSSNYNQELTQEVLSLRDAFISQGSTPAASLEKAVNFVVKTNSIEAVGEEATLDAPAPKQATKPADQVAKKRKEVLKAAETQPPDMPGESSSAHGEKVVDISSMTDDEFNALPEATLKRLRGDIG